MASILKVDELQGIATTNDITVTVGATATQSLETGLIKAFVHFDQSDQSADSSMNISSITDDGVGKSLPQFSNAFSGNQFPALASQVGSTNIDTVLAGPNTTSQSFVRMRDGGVDTDTNNISHICCGDLA